MSLHSFLRPGAAPAPPTRITIRRRLLGRGSRLRTVGLAAGLLSLGLASVQTVHAATYSWNGVPGDWFSNPSNWTLGSMPAAYPSASDDAQNLTTAAMTLGQSTTVNSFLSDGTFTLNGGTFSGNKANAASTLQINNIFTLNGGQINNFTVNAGVQQSGQPAPSVVVANNGNNSLSNTIVNANVDMTQAGGGAFLRLFNTNTINGAITLGTLNNNGTYGLRLNNGANLVFGSTGTLQGFGVVSEETSASTLTSSGLVNASSAGNTLNFTQSVFNNNVGATAEATNGGILSLNNTTNNSGSVKAVGANSVVGITGTFTGTGTTAQGNLITASGGGQVQVNGASLLGTINTTSGTALVIGNNDNRLNNTTVNGNLDMTQAGGGAFLRLLGTDTVNGAITLGTLNNNGTYGLRLNNGATLNIGAGVGNGSSLTGFGVVSEETSASTLTNNGLINANNNGNTLNLSQTYFNNNAGATAEATLGGILSLNNTTNSSGAVKAVGANSVVGITGTFTGTGTAAQGNLITASGGGQVQVNGASLLGTINTTSGTALVIGNNDNRLNNTMVNGNLDMTQAGGGAFLRLLGTDTVNGAITLGTLNNNGTYGLRLNNGATLLLNGGSSLTGFGVVSEETSASTLTSSGLVNASSAGNTLNFTQSVFNNNVGATAEATNGGILSLNNTTNNSGSVKAVGANSVVGITGTFTGTGTAAQGNLITASGGGQVQVNGASLLGTINTDAATALLFNGSGNNNLSNTVVNGNLNVAESDQGSFLRLYGTDTVNGAITLGTVNNNGSYGLRLNNGATLNIGASTGNGSSLTGFGNVSEETSASTLTNNGLVNANSAGNTLGMTQNTFNNNGTAEATGGGILSLNNNTNNTVGATIAAIGKSGTNVGSVVAITGTFTGAGNNLITASGGGQVQVNGASLLGTINTDAATALLFNGSGNNNLSNTVVNGNLNVAESDQGSFLRLFNTDTVNGAITLGTVNNNGSYGLRLNNGATLNIGAGVGNGSSLTGFGNVSEETSASTLTNNNLVNANASGLMLTMGQNTFNNSAGATAEATSGGILSLNNNTNNSGMVKAVGAGSTIGITGTFTGTGTAAQGNLITASGGGQVQVNGASLLGTINTDAATALLFNGSGNNNLSSTVVNGNLNVAEADTASFLRLYGTDTVNGAITLGTVNNNGSYGLRLNNGATLVVGSAGTLQGFGVVSEETSASTVTNNGLINANTTGGNSLTFNQANFNNTSTGTTQVANGAALVVNSANVTNSGAISVIQGGTANFSSGLTQTAGSTNVFGTVNASETVKGGVLEGFGKVVGNVTNTGGIVQSTTPTGLTIQGNFTQANGGELDAFFGNNFHDLLTVTGQTTLAGTLGVFDLDSSQPAGMAAAGSQFSFLNYSSGTLVAPGTLGGFTQYFSNEIPLDNNTGTILGQNGFTYQLINNTTNGTLDLKVVTAGSPVPEASTTVSLGLLLALGMGGMVIASKRKKKA